MLSQTASTDCSCVGAQAQPAKVRLLAPASGAKAARASSGRGAAGQATVEFALVLFAFLAVLVGLGALAGFGRGGALAEHALSGASHHVGGETGAWADVLAY